MHKKSKITNFAHAWTHFVNHGFRHQDVENCILRLRPHPLSVPLAGGHARQLQHRSHQEAALCQVRSLEDQDQGDVPQYLSVDAVFFGLFS